MSGPLDVRSETTMHTAKDEGAERIVFALDHPSLEAARASAELLANDVGMLKVGLELFVASGPEGVRAIASAGAPVFLDLKLHDIPATVERAVLRAVDLGARVLTVHAAGGGEMLARAVKRAEGSSLAVTAVTVLTSLGASDLAAQGIDASPAEHAEKLARLAFDHGVRSFVCSPEEVARLRAALGPSATFFTPGVRPQGAQGHDDQKRTATAAEAIARGADYVVVGRPIRDAKDPREAARAIAREISAARAAAKEGRSA